MLACHLLSYAPMGADTGFSTPSTREIGIQHKEHLMNRKSSYVPQVGALDRRGKALYNESGDVDYIEKCFQRLPHPFNGVVISE